eukprot:9096599-Alexandrium_andersonii.AAC.1
MDMSPAGLRFATKGDQGVDELLRAAGSRKVQRAGAHPRAEREVRVGILELPEEVDLALGAILPRARDVDRAPKGRGR